MDDITEVIVIEDDGMDDDIEEGEITDDSGSEIEIIEPPEPKKLPKHYCLQAKKVAADKHKKDCKYSLKSSQKSKNVRSSPVSNGIYKKHKSSCQLQRQKSYTDKNHSYKCIPPAKYLPAPFSNDSSSKVSAFKNFTSPPRSLLIPSHPISGDNENYSDLLLSYKKCRDRENQTFKKKSKDFNESSRQTSITPKSSDTKNKSKYFTNENSAPKKSKNKHSLGEGPCPKMILNEKSPKNEIKMSLNKISPPKTVDNNSLHKKSSPLKVDSKQPQDHETSKPEFGAQDEHEVYDLIDEIAEKEESDDEEELRRIALATCAMRALKKQRAEAKQVNNIANSVDSLSNQSSATSVVNDNHGDNYEVVDMELDDEIFVENVEENLFFIDNNPALSSEFNQDIMNGDCDMSMHNYLPPQKDIYRSPNLPQKDIFLPPKQTQSTEDFEEARLRAELIASINYKKTATISPQPVSVLPSNPLDSTKKDIVSLEKIIVKPQSQILKAAYYNGQTFNSIGTNVKRTDVVKLNNSKMPNSKKAIVPKPRNINATQERLIITLNNDSSTDESDEDEPSNGAIEDNTVSSIDALISNARLNSDMKTNGANLNHVSCLSKAQQEEYKKLRSLLAEKEPMTIIPQPVREKSIAENQNLNFLTNKISLAREKFDKEMKLLSNTQKEVLTKKRMFITSKLKFQHLQEQLHAAKLSKSANLKDWKLCEAKLVNAKNSVAKQKALISLLEAEFNSRQIQFDQNSSSPIL